MNDGEPHKQPHKRQTQTHTQVKREIVSLPSVALTSGEKAPGDPKCLSYCDLTAGSVLLFVVVDVVVGERRE